MKRESAVRKTQVICNEKKVYKIKELFNTYKECYIRCNIHARLMKLGPVVRRYDIIVIRGHPMVRFSKQACQVLKYHKMRQPCKFKEGKERVIVL